MTVVPISETETPQVAWFLRNYRHVSGNDLVYERFCTARFMGVQRVMDLHGLKTAATFDMDIAAARARADCSPRVLPLLSRVLPAPLWPPSVPGRVHVVPVGGGCGRGVGVWQLDQRVDTRLPGPLEPVHRGLLCALCGWALGGARDRFDALRWAQTTATASTWPTTWRGTAR